MKILVSLSEGNPTTGDTTRQGKNRDQPANAYEHVPPDNPYDLGKWVADERKKRDANVRSQQVHREERKERTMGMAATVVPSAPLANTALDLTTKLGPAPWDFARTGHGNAPETPELLNLRPEDPLYADFQRRHRKRTLKVKYAHPDKPRRD